MCISGMGGAMPPQVPPSGGATAPAAAPASAPAAPAATTGVAGDAGAGAATLAGGPPGSLAAVLQQLVSAIQGVISALGGAPAGAPPVTGSGPTRDFEAAARSAVALPMPTQKSGPAVVQHLDTVVQARRQRVEQLTAALASDFNKTGNTNQIDQQQLVMEQRLVEHVAGLADKLRPISSSIDEAEGTAVLQMVQQANNTGSLAQGQVMRVVMQVDGSARGLPAQFLASTARSADVMDRLSADLKSQQERLAASTNATGVVDQNAVAQLTAHQGKIEQFTAGVKRLFDGAATNSAAAQAQLDGALAQPNLELMLQALA